MSPAKRLLLTIGLPPLVLGIYFLESRLPGFLADLYDDTLGPFLLTYWIGLNFSNMYAALHLDLQHSNYGPGAIALACGGLAALFFIAGGGPRMIWEDTWMFGIIVMPGFDIALPNLERWLRSRHAAPGQTSSTDVSLDLNGQGHVDT